MNFFLRLRHWQLFLLMLLVPILCQIIFMGIMISSESPRLLMLLFPIVMLWYIGTYFGWMYSVSKAMHEKVPFQLRGTLSRFRVFMLIPIIYMLCLSLYVALMSHFQFNGLSSVAFLCIVMPLHLFSMFCIFYCLYFCAKTLKAAEWQRPVTFSDFAGEFFLLWFFPIGVWILQPRINRLAADTGNNDQLLEGQVFP